MCNNFYSDMSYVIKACRYRICISRRLIFCKQCTRDEKEENTNSLDVSTSRV